MRWFVVLAALATFGGCLQISTPDGALMCSDTPKRACPEGWYCLAADNTCWHDGHFPEDMAEAQPFFPGGPDDLSAAMGDDMSPEPDLGVPNDLTSNDDLLQTD